MNILLFGCNGQLGWELQRTLAPLGKISAYDLDTLDITRTKELCSTIQNIRPEIIINASAYTAVDKAETEHDLAMMVNGIIPGIMAEEAKKISACVIHFSTDYVFDGNSSQDYIETDPCNPINTYGSTKLAGEKAIQMIDNPHMVLRTSWVYSLRRPSFVSKVIDWAKKNKTLRVVTDQIGSPTWSRMLAEVTALMLSKSSHDLYSWMFDHSGVYHLGGLGSASRMEIAQTALSFYQNKEELIYQDILPAKTSEFPTAAQRPLRTSLNCDKFQQTFGINLPDWKAALRLAMN